MCKNFFLYQGSGQKSFHYLKHRSYEFMPILDEFKNRYPKADMTKFQFVSFSLGGYTIQETK